MSAIREFYDMDVRERWHGAHTVPYDVFFARMFEAFQELEHAPQDALNGVYVRGPLAGLSGTNILALWRANAATA